MNEHKPKSTLKGITQNDFAKAVGSTATTINRLVRLEVLSAYDDKSLNAPEAYRQYIDHYKSEEQKAKPGKKVAVDHFPETFDELLRGAGKIENPRLTSMQVKAETDILKKEKLQIEINAMKGRLIDKEMARREIANIAIHFRNELSNAPSRLAPAMAARLAVDEHKLRMELVKAFTKIQDEANRRIERIEREK